jgi:hypothetical protein
VVVNVGVWIAVIDFLSVVNSIAIIVIVFRIIDAVVVMVFW